MTILASDLVSNTSIRGAQGYQGFDGVQGFQGNQGYQGLTGADSSVEGPQGPQGDIGNQGPQGQLNVDGETVTGLFKIKSLMETITIDSSTTLNYATYNWDLLSSGNFKYFTNALGGSFFTMNIRGDGSNSLNSIMNTGDSIVIAFLVTSNLERFTSSLRIDGTVQSIKWIDAYPPSGGSSSPALDMYTFTILKTASATYTVLGSLGRYA